MKKFKYILFFFATFLTFKSGVFALPNGCSKDSIANFNSQVVHRKDLTGLSLICDYDKHSTYVNYYSGEHIEIWQNTSYDSGGRPIFYVFNVTFSQTTNNEYKLLYCSYDDGANLEVHTPVYTTESGYTYEEGFTYIDKGVVTDVTEDGIYWDGHKGDLHKSLVSSNGTFGVCPYWFGTHTDSTLGYKAIAYSYNSDYHIQEGDTAGINFGKCTSTDVTHKAVAEDVVADKKIQMKTDTTSQVTDDVKAALDSNTDYEDTLRNYESNLCKTDGVLKIFRGLKIVVTIAKILVPLIIIIIGAVNFSKAALDDNADALNKNIKLLVKQIIIGIVVFFIPTIVTIFIGFIDDKFFEDSSISNCITCFSGSKSECDEAISFYEVYRYKLVDPYDLTQDEADMIADWYKNHDQELTLMMDDLVEKQKSNR